MLIWERAPTPAPNTGLGAFTPTHVSSVKGSRSGTPPTPGSRGTVLNRSAGGETKWDVETVYVLVERGPRGRQHIHKEKGNKKGNRW